MKATQLFALSAMLIFLTACGGDDNSKSEQTISFGALAPHNLSERSFELNATASSGLPVSFKSSDLSVASVSGKTVTLLKKGSTTITATQPGNGSYFEAPAITQTLLVNEDNNAAKKNQTITFNLAVTAWNFADGELPLEATSSSGLPVKFSATHPNIVIEGATLKLIYTGVHYNDDVTITAYQEGNDEYNAAPNVGKPLHISHTD